MTEATNIAPGLKDHGKAMASHARDFGGATVDAGKAAYGKANDLARSGVDKAIELGGKTKDAVKADGFWETVAGGARKHPLIAGATLVTAGYVATKAIAGPRQQKVVMDHSAERDQGRTF
jgi:hypothetical protein